ncbi:MAG: hypothetical protein SGI96_21310 [Bacteroidota bacterium]|nr:hypothetical protein [Bacteroidota bacterium]
MTVLSLDLATKTGWALLEKAEEKIKLRQYGLIETPLEKFAYPYPKNLVLCANEMSEQLIGIYNLFKPDMVVIEETNIPRGGYGSRYSHKILEFIHFAFNDLLISKNKIAHYISTSEWRMISGVSLGKEQRDLNKEIAKDREKRKDIISEELMGQIKERYGLGIIDNKEEQKRVNKLIKEEFKKRIKKRVSKMSKTRVGGVVTPKVTIKDASVIRVNEMFGTSFGKKNHDTAEAILLGVAFIKKGKL